MLDIKNNKILIIIVFLIFYESFFGLWNDKFMTFKIYIYKKLYHNSIVEISLAGIKSRYGPGSLLRGINQVLPFTWRNCSFISSHNIRNYIKPDFFFFPSPKFSENNYHQFIKTNLINKFILGPLLVPKHWNSFPSKNLWVEMNFPVILNLSKGIAVHSSRVRDYLANKTNTSYNINKFKIIRPCTNLKPKTVKSFEDRKIDILFFEKYADLNRRKQGKELLNLFKNTSKFIVPIRYGSYNSKIINELANNSKFIIYFSFYDTGAIGLKEIQNYGVICFTHQKEFAIDNETSFFISELANIDNINIAFNKIMDIIEKISKSNINTELIAKKNQIINKCENSLIDLCKSLS